MKRSPHTVKAYLEKPEIAGEVADTKLELANLYQEKAKKVLAEVSDEDIKKASLQQKAVSSGIFLDKTEMLRLGQGPGVNVNVMINLLDAIRGMRG